MTIARFRSLAVCFTAVASVAAFAAAPVPNWKVKIVNDSSVGTGGVYNTNYVASADGLYPMGAKPKFWISASCNGVPGAGAVVDATVNASGRWYQPKTVPVTLDAKGEAWLEADAPTEPGWVQVTVAIGKAKAAAGAICGKDAIRPALPPPADFKAFWDAEIAAAAKCPMKATLKEVEPQKHLKDKVRTWEFSVTCAGPRPATGYMSMPVNAKPKSLPLYVGFNGSGDVAAYRSDHYGEVAICIQVNKFGIPNNLGEPWDYAKTPWYESDIKLYARRGMESPKTAFLKWMILRNLRAMEWGKSLPEWNGRDFLLNGESYGGGQVLIMGALDPDVKFVCSCVPALCDHNAARVGRQNGYGQDVTGHSELWRPDADGKLAEKDRVLAETARYFDAVNFCTLYTPDKEVSIGTGYCDTMCPPDGVISAYHAIPAGVKKYLWLNPPAGHDAGNWHGGRRLFDILGKW